MAALESFKTLSESIPEWLERLEHVARQVAERHAEFARLSRSDSLTSFDAHRLRKQQNGSTESLRPIDERMTRPTSPPAAPPPPPAPFTPPALTPDNSAPDAATSNRPSTPASPIAAVAATATLTPPTTATARVPIDPSSRHLFQTFREQAAAARRKRKSSASLHSQASGPPRARSRRSLIVLYDGAVQDGLAALVRRVAGARNALRKARLAASAAARLAGLGVEESPFAGARPDAGRLRLPKVPRLPRGDGMFGAPVADPRGEAFEELDRELEAAQSLCEVAAHQFLREGGCKEEMEGTRERFETCAGIAGAMVERLGKEQEEKQIWKVEEEKQRWKAEEESGDGKIEIDDVAAMNEVRGNDPLAIDVRIDAAPTIDAIESRHAPMVYGIKMDEHPKIDNTSAHAAPNIHAIAMEHSLKVEPIQVDVALDTGIAIEPAPPEKRPTVDAADMGINIDSMTAADAMVAIDNEPTDFKIDLTAFRRTRRM